MKKTLVNTLSFLLLGALLSLSSTTFAGTGTDYIAVVNAGSTGSRLYLYTYPTDSQSKLKLPTLVDSTKVKQGVATIDPSAISAYLQPLFQLVQKDVPAGTPVNLYFLSTAGMRLLSFDQQQAINTAITNTAKSSGLTPAVIQTITGKMEGAFDWIALNQLLNNLGQAPSQTVGILDLGGASTELTFTGSGMDSTDTVTLNLANQTYTLYSHSYLGLGENIAQSQYMNAAECYPIGYSLPDSYMGTGEFKTCQKHLMSLLSKVQQVANIQQFIPSNTTMNFYAISGFAYTNTSKIFNLGVQLNSKSLSNSASTACAQTWSLLNQQDPSDPYLYSTCFNAALAVNLLNTYGFSPSKTFTASNTIGSDDIDWTLGAAIYYLNLQPSY